MLARDGADFLQAQTVQLGHHIMIRRVGAVKMSPVGEALLDGIRQVEASDGFRLLVMAVPGKPIVVAEDEPPARAQQAGHRSKNPGQIGQVFRGIVQSGHIK